MQKQIHTGLRYFVAEMKLFISIVLLSKYVPEHVPEEIIEFIGNKNLKANIFRVQENDSIMCGYFCFGFIDIMLAGIKLTDYTNLFSPHDFKKKDDIILSNFKNE